MTQQPEDDIGDRQPVAATEPRPCRRTSAQAAGRRGRGQPRRRVDTAANASATSIGSGRITTAASRARHAERGLSANAAVADVGFADGIDPSATSCHRATRCRSAIRRSRRPRPSSSTRPCRRPHARRPATAGRADRAGAPCERTRARSRALSPAQHRHRSPAQGSARDRARSVTRCTVAPCSERAVGERLPVGVQAGIERQQRRMDVDDATGMATDEAGPRILMKPARTTQVRALAPSDRPARSAIALEPRDR